MEILKAFINSWGIELGVLILLILSIYGVKVVIRYDKQGRLYSILLALCIEAEKYLGSGTGELKKQQVIAWFLQRHKYLSLFINVSVLSNIIDVIIENVNKYLKEKDIKL